MNLALHHFRTEQRLYWRSRELAFFTFLLPIIFFVLLGSVYGNDEIDGVDGSAYLLAGILGYGVVATAFAGLAIITVIRREEGVLKRLRGTPLPAWAYLAAVIASTLFVYAIEAVALVVLGRALFDVPFPDRWLSLVLTLLLGGLAFAALGLGLTGVDPLCGGLVGGRQRDLPADGLHLRRVLLGDRVPVRHRGDRRRPPARRTSSS